MYALVMHNKDQRMHNMDPKIPKVRIDNALYTPLKLEADNDSRTVTGLINKILRDHLKKVTDKVNDFGRAGIRTSIETKTTPQGMTTTVTPNPDDVAKAKENMANMLADAERVRTPIIRDTPPTGGQLKEDVPPPSTAEPVSISNEKPCCSKKSRCQHWAWDDTNMEWVNSLSGRKVANE